MSNDLISIRGIEGYGYHGVLPEEKTNGQPFVVDLQVFTDIAEAAADDTLDKAVDYSVLANEVVDVVQGDPCDLIETVAVRIADQVLAHPRVSSVRVTVHKPRAPVGVPVADISVTVERSR